jgi:carboxylesterase
MNVDIMPGCEAFSANGSAMGVLVLHGFTGNPASMRSIAERCAVAGYTVQLPRLPGHGTSLEDMMTTTWADWSGAALAAYDDLASRTDRVAVVGLSMGGGLTAYVAEERPEVAGCVFINPLVKSPGAEMEEGLAQAIEAGMESIESIGSDIKKEGVTEASYSATPLGCVASLFAGVKSVEANLATIVAPSLLLSSREDHVVTSDNGDAIVERSSGPVERRWLEESYHVATMDNDQELLESATMEFLSKVLV